jgi:regulator of replication initiation timing
LNPHPASSSDNDLEPRGEGQATSGASQGIRITETEALTSEIDALCAEVLLLRTENGDLKEKLEKLTFKAMVFDERMKETLLDRKNLPEELVQQLEDERDAHVDAVVARQQALEDLARVSAELINTENEMLRYKSEAESLRARISQQGGAQALQPTFAAAPEPSHTQVHVFHEFAPRQTESKTGYAPVFVVIATVALVAILLLLFVGLSSAMSDALKSGGLGKSVTSFSFDHWCGWLYRALAT